MPPQEIFKIISSESEFQWYFSYRIVNYIDVSSYIIKDKGYYTYAVRIIK